MSSAHRNVKNVSNQQTAHDDQGNSKVLFGQFFGIKNGDIEHQIEQTGHK
ncbi:MAG: hypothetical protein RIR68_1286, partial [Pseudomonadota bacterium]